MRIPLVIMASIFFFLGIIFNSVHQVTALMARPESQAGAYILQGQHPCYSQKALRLVLHNTYSFPIIVTLNGVSEHGDIRPAYELVAVSRSNKQVVTIMSEEVRTSQTVRPGGQLSVCIDKLNLARNSYLRIPFKFDSESDTARAAAPQHFAIFYSDSIK